MDDARLQRAMLVALPVVTLLVSLRHVAAYPARTTALVLLAVVSTVAVLRTPGRRTGDRRAGTALVLLPALPQLLLLSWMTSGRVASGTVWLLSAVLSAVLLLVMRRGRSPDLPKP